MFNKKILLIISVILVLLALVFYFFSQKKTTPVMPPPSQPDKSSLPIESDQNQKIISTAATDEDILEVTAEFISQKPTEPLIWLKISNSTDQPISLDKFAHAVGMNIEPQLKNLLDVNNYELFACNDAGEVSHGILMNIRLLPNYQGNLYQDEVAFMQDWENSLFQDTAKIIFPNYSFNQNQLQQSVSFRDGVYRFADIILPDNASGSINYNLIDDYVIISSSKDCLAKASETVYSTSD
jgi:hypothetical protein